MAMRTLRAFAALADKEIHTSRLPILLQITLCPFIPIITPGTLGGLYILLKYLPGLIAMLWGATNGDSQNPKRTFERANLPVSNNLILTVTYGLPCCLLLITSQITIYADFYFNGGSIEISSLIVPLLAIFSFAYFVSLLYSQRAGLVAGVLAVTMLIGSEFGNSGGLLLEWCLFVGSMIAVLLITLCKPFMRRSSRRSIGIGIVAFCVAIPMAVIIVPKMLMSNVQEFCAHTYTTPDKTITIQATKSAYSSARFDQDVAEFKDVDTGKTCMHTFESGWHAAWVVNARIAYFLESDDARNGAMVTRWDTQTDKLSVVARIPVKPNWETLCCNDHFASVDPSGRYMIARLPAIRNASVDLWLIDLRKGMALVLIQNAAYFQPNATRWLPGKALVPSYQSRIIQVDTLHNSAKYAGASAEGN